MRLRRSRLENGLINNRCYEGEQSQLLCCLAQGLKSRAVWRSAQCPPAWTRFNKIASTHLAVWSWSPDYDHGPTEEPGLSAVEGFQSTEETCGRAFQRGRK